MRLAGRLLPGVQYWRGIREALEEQGTEVITATVPPSGSIEERAEELARDIETGARGKGVNIIAYAGRFLGFIVAADFLIPLCKGIVWGKIHGPAFWTSTGLTKVTVVLIRDT